MATQRPCIVTASDEKRQIETGDTISRTWLPSYPRSLFVYIDDETTAGTSEETLVTDNIAAATLTTNKDRIDFQYNGAFAANANEKYLNVYFNGVQRFTSDVQAGNNRAWEIRGRIVRYSNTIVRLSFIFTTDVNAGGLLIATGQVDVTSLNLTTTAYALALKATTPDAAGDVTMSTGSIDYNPAP